MRRCLPARNALHKVNNRDSERSPRAEKTVWFASFLSYRYSCNQCLFQVFKVCFVFVYIADNMASRVIVRAVRSGFQT